MRFLSSAAILCSGLSLLASASSLEQRTVASDVCVELNVALKVPILGTSITIGDLEACVCLSTVQSFVQSNVLCVTATLLVSEEQVISIVTDLINENNPQSCQYPDHAVPSCEFGNPCGFSCTDGYSYSSPSQCVCNAPFTACNGKCVLGLICPSAYARRDNLNAGTIKNLSKRSMNLCPLGYSACGVLGGSETSWECVNTKSDLESCGGCMLRLPSASSLEPQGQDCTAIAGVSDVSCVGGSCVVHRCMPGFDISNDGSSCVERNEWAKFQVADWM